MKDFDRKVFFIHGGTDTETREKIHEITEKETSNHLSLSYGTFSTGINIRNLHNVVFDLRLNLEYEWTQSIEDRDFGGNQIEMIYTQPF